MNMNRGKVLAVDFSKNNMNMGQRIEAAKQKAEAKCSDKMSQHINRQGKGAVLFTSLFKPEKGFLRGWFFGTDPAAQTAEAFHSIQIVAMVADTLHPGNRLAGYRLDTDMQAVGNGEDLCLNTVGP